MLFNGLTSKKAIDLLVITGKNVYYVAMNFAFIRLYYLAGISSTFTQGAVSPNRQKELIRGYVGLVINQ